MESSRRPATSVIVAASIDVSLVLVFALIGRASHGEGLLGVLTTWWPFLCGLAIGWVIMRAWQAPRRIVWTGIGVWLCSVAGGMLLRVASGQGIQPSFILVATIVLGVLLLGWRAIALLPSRLRRSPSRA